MVQHVPMLIGSPNSRGRLLADDAVGNRSHRGRNDYADLDIDVGLAGGASVGDVGWLDVDGDDVQDPGEPGIPGVDVTVGWAGFDGTFGIDDDVENRDRRHGSQRGAHRQ